MAFDLDELLCPDQQRDRLAALLCYLGALTVGGKTPDAEVILEIPNLVTRKLYAERILNLTFDLGRSQRIDPAPVIKEPTND